jgi:hypothetical protein
MELQKCRHQHAGASNVVSCHAAISTLLTWHCWFYLSLSIYQAEVLDIVSQVILQHTENIFSTVMFLRILRENDF